MKSGADWYKRDPVAYLGGVQGLSAKEHAVYSVVLDLIYQHGGAINDDPKWISGWISDMGSAAVRTAISALVQMGKIERENGLLTQKRARNEAKTREKLRETRAKLGEKGGVSSAVSRRASSQNNDLGQAIASPREEKRREEYTDAEEARAGNSTEKPPPDLTFRERILTAIGVDPISGMTGHGGTMLGRTTDMAEAGRWTGDLGLTEVECLTVISEIANLRTGRGPPRSFRYFTPAMQDLANAKAAPKLTVIPAQGGTNATRASSSRSVASDADVRAIVAARFRHQAGQCR
ncbi:MAG: DUF1376 domain-containing protein [Pseudomonadota bacterium]